MKKIIVFVIIAIFVVSNQAFAQNTVKKQYWPNGKIRLSEKVDPMGNTIEKVYYYQDGKKELIEKYDKLGNKILEANLNQQGKLKENEDGWAILMWKFSGDNMVAEGYYGSDGKLEELKQYDEEGEIVNKKYYGDKDLIPSEEFNPEPTLAGESDQYYDKYGRLEGTTSVEYYDDFFPFSWDIDDIMDDELFRSRYW